MISITNSNNFIKVEHLPVLSDGEDRERVNIIINTTNQKAEELGLDLKYDIFSIIESIEKQIIIYCQNNFYALDKMNKSPANNWTFFIILSLCQNLHLLISLALYSYHQHT